MAMSGRLTAPAPAPTATSPTSCPPTTEFPKLSPQRKRVFEYMSANPRATARECSVATGMPLGSVRQQLGHLRSAGLIPGRVVRELSPQRAKVFEYMTANPRATARECAAETGLSFSSVRQHQFRLRTAGLLPLAPDGALRGGNLRALIARHEKSRRRILDQLEVIAAAEHEVPVLLDPGRRRRQCSKRRGLEGRLRHHESRLATLAGLKQA